MQPSTPITCSQGLRPQHAFSSRKSYATRNRFDVCTQFLFEFAQVDMSLRIMRLCARPRCSKRFDLPTCNSTSNGNKSGGTIDNSTESSQILACRVPIRCTEKPQLCGSLDTKVLPPRSLQDHITSIICNMVHTSKSTPSAVKCDSLRLHGGPTRP